MDVLQNSNVKSKGNGGTAFPRRHNPANVVSLPTALTQEQRRQQAAFHRHVGALTAFLETPSPTSEARARDTGFRWISAFLGEGLDAERARRSLNLRLRDVQYRILVGRLHALGERQTGELLQEVIGSNEQLRDDVFALLERYTRLTPAEVQAVGADVFPSVPLHAVPAP